MKRYIISAMLATFVGGVLTSCHDTDIQYSSIAESKLAQFQENFEKFYGEVSPNQDWGFGDASSSRTRATGLSYNAELANLSFRDTNPIQKPTLSATYYTTQTEVTTNVPHVDNMDQSKWDESGVSVYVDASSAWVLDKKNQIIYVVGNVDFKNPSGQTGIVYVVTEGSSLTIGGFGQHQSIVLRKNATLTLTKNATIDGGLVYMEESSMIDAGGKDLYFKNGTKVLVSNKASIIKANNIYLQGTQGTSDNVTLWNEGTITVKNKLQGSEINAYIYNAAGKTIEAGELNLINNNDLLYNDGIVTVKGATSTQNDGAEIVNTKNAKFTCVSYSQAAGGKFHNIGTVSMTGLTYLDNSNSGWVNDGKWTCGSYQIIGDAKGSNRNFNNCLLTVTNKDGDTGELKLARGVLILGAGAGVVCESFYFDDTSFLWLGGASVVKVKGTLTTNNYNYGYGIEGYDSDYAVLQANKIDKTGDHQYSMNYYGNLLVATSDHFPPGSINNNGVDQPYYYYDTTVKFTFKNEDISPISADECNPGYKSNSTPTTGGSTGSTTTSTDVYIKKEVKLHKWVFCEDLGSSYTKADFDYNDLVFDVKVIDEYRVVRDADGTETAYTGDTSHSYYALFTPLAAGGELKIMFSGCDKFAHAMFSPAWGDNVLINTAKDPDALAATCKYSTGTSESFKCLEQSTLPTLDDINNVDINVSAKYNDGTVAVWSLTAYKGKAPHKICVPPGTQWPYERVSIDLAYTGFSNYVERGDEPWDNGDNDNLYPLTDLAENLKTNQVGLAYEYVKDTENSTSTTTYSISPSSSETLVWQNLEGTSYLGSDWSNQDHVFIDYNTLAQADPNNKPFGVGSVIRAYVNTEDGFNVQLFTQDAAYNWTKLFESYYGNNDSHISNNSGYVEYTVTKADCDVLKRGLSYLVVSGIKATLLGVTVDNTNAVQPQQQQEEQEPTFTAPTLAADQTSILSNNSGVALTSEGVGVTNGLSQTGENSEFTVYGIGDSNASVSVTTSDGTALSTVSSARTRTAEQKSFKFKVQSETVAAKIRSNGIKVKVTGGSFKMYMLAAKIVEKQNTETPTSSVVLYDKSKDGAVSKEGGTIYVDKNEFNNASGKTLKIEFFDATSGWDIEVVGQNWGNIHASELNNTNKANETNCPNARTNGYFTIVLNDTQASMLNREGLKVIVYWATISKITLY